MHSSDENDAHRRPVLVRDFVARFDLHRETFKQQEYNETQVRCEFDDEIAIVEEAAER